MFSSLIPRTSPLPRSLSRMEKDFEEMFERMHDGWLPLGPRFPLTNVAETDDSVEVTVELPGLKPEEFDVELHDGDLWISGEKKEEKEEKGKSFHRIERHHGEFRRIVPLPAGVDKEQVEATYGEGVLKVVIAKSEASQGKHIEVKARETQA